MNKHTEVLFKETQRFRQWWIWLLLAIAILPTWGIAFYQLVLGNKAGNRPAPDVVVLILWVGIGLIFPYFIYSVGLTVEVRSVGLFYRFNPLHLTFRAIPFEQIATTEAVTYHPLMEYGGWGIRLGKSGLAYNVSGNRGVRVHLINGKQILFGSQKAEEFNRAIQAGKGL